MHFKGYLQLIHKIKKLKEGFVCFKYFTDQKKQMKDCINTKYLDLNSNTHRGKHHFFRPEDLSSYFSCSPLPFTALDTLDRGLRRKRLANAVLFCSLCGSKRDKSWWLHEQALVISDN